MALQKFAVTSVYLEETQVFTDFVLAQNRQAALELVRRARPYIEEYTVDALSAAELREQLAALEGATDLPSTALELAKSLGEAEHLCRECGADNEDGEGWDGLCGPCADKKEKDTPREPAAKKSTRARAGA